jgi:antitoxin component of MazEF toxin-antitoxin module
MEAVIKRWGNSYAVRLTKADLQRLHLREGQAVVLHVEPAAGEVDLSGLPTFRAGARLAEARRRYYREARDWE